MPARPTLTELFDHGEFSRRHIGPTAHEQEAMLAVVGSTVIAAIATGGGVTGTFTIESR